MKEYKFRGIRIDNEEWVYGCYVNLDYHNSLDYVEVSQIVLTNGHVYEIIPSSVGQFTGLLDSKGREIYEGDIIRILYTDWISKSESDSRTLEQYMKDISKIGVVKYFCPDYGLDFDGYTDHIFEGKHGQKEIIGNIYESKHLLDPELLEGKEK